MILKAIWIDGEPQRITKQASLRLQGASGATAEQGTVGPRMGFNIDDKVTVSSSMATIGSEVTDFGQEKLGPQLARKTRHSRVPSKQHGTNAQSHLAGIPEWTPLARPSWCYLGKYAIILFQSSRLCLTRSYQGPWGVSMSTGLARRLPYRHQFSVQGCRSALRAE